MGRVRPVKIIFIKVCLFISFYLNPAIIQVIETHLLNNMLHNTITEQSLLYS